MSADLPELGFRYRYRPAPEGTDRPGHTMLLLHGAGGDEDSLWSVGERVAPGGALLSPRGKVEEDGPRFFRRASPGVIDIEDLHACAGELAAFVAEACNAFELDPGAVWVLGFSNGATAATALAVDHPETLAGGVVLAGMAPFRSHGRILDGKKFFCGHGRSDELVTTADYEDVVELLVSSGAEVELHWYDSGHEISAVEVTDVAAWLQRQLEAT